MAHSPILVLSSRGKTGRRVVARLDRLGLAVRTASRSGQTRFDLADPETWAAALDGVKAVYIVPMTGEEPVPTAAVAGFVEAAEYFGVRRLVLLSVRGPEGSGDPSQEAVENAVRQSGLEWTILRSAWFAQNFSEGILRDELLGGVLTTAAGDGSEAFVDIEDLADVAVAALTTDGHSGKIYDLSGPQALSFEQAVGLIAAAGGPKARYESVDDETYIAAQISYGVPAEVAHVVTELFGAIRGGGGNYISDGVRQALGRPPRTFSEFAADAVAAGAWND